MRATCMGARGSRTRGHAAALAPRARGRDVQCSPPCPVLPPCQYSQRRGGHARGTRAISSQHRPVERDASGPPAPGARQGLGFWISAHEGWSFLHGPAARAPPPVSLKLHCDADAPPGRPPYVVHAVGIAGAAASAFGQ